MGIYTLLLVFSARDELIKLDEKEPKILFFENYSGHKTLSFCDFNFNFLLVLSFIVVKNTFYPMKSFYFIFGYDY